LAPRPEPARGPGRPSSGARERLLEAGLEVLKAEGYAGLTTAKVAARSGDNKALIGYHFGSKQGLVAAVGREVSESITADVLDGLEQTERVEDLMRGVLAGLWRVMDRDERLARLYFDLAAVSVVEPDVRAIMHEMKSSWRTITAELLTGAGDGPPARDAEAASVYAIAGLEGLMLERLDRGQTPALERAMEMFVSSAAAVISSR
jgi:AcrR family transcriptional regulator